MTRELLILRHGKAYPDTGAGDQARPLKDRGKRDAQRIGVWMGQQRLSPSPVVSSPAERAFNTAEKACKAMGLGADSIRTDERLFGAGMEQVLAVVREFPDESRCGLLVGHDPDLEGLLEFLTGPMPAMPESRKLLPTAGLARLRLQSDWAVIDAGCARLMSIVRPVELPRKFPFPTLDGGEYRDRPAYYYTQSAVIPFRVRKGRLELLLIMSSRKKQWLFPKGIKTVGVTPQQSAAQEAEEEAGVKGNVLDPPVGVYSYEKWGASCTVTVYPMAVTRILVDSEWEERHRGRHWIGPEEAGDFLKHEGLKALVKRFADRFRHGARFQA